MMAEFNLAACAEMIFTDLPITERVRHIDDLGFQVEIWNHAQIGEGNLVERALPRSLYLGTLAISRRTTSALSGQGCLASDLEMANVSS